MKTKRKNACSLKWSNAASVGEAFLGADKKNYAEMHSDLALSFIKLSF